MNVRIGIVAIFIGSILMSCSTAQLKGAWKDTEKIEKINKVLVVGVAIRKNRRQLFETTLANKLKDHGVFAIPSFAVFPKEEMNDRATSDYIKQQKIDSVIVVKVLNSKALKRRVTESTLHTTRSAPVGVPYHQRFNGWYADYSYWTTTVATYDTGYILSNMEANLYQQDNKDMVWTSYVEVNASDDDVSSVKDIAKALVKQMKKDGLF